MPVATDTAGLLICLGRRAARQTETERGKEKQREGEWWIVGIWNKVEAIVKWLFVQVIISPEHMLQILFERVTPLSCARQAAIIIHRAEETVGEAAP